MLLTKEVDYALRIIRALGRGTKCSAKGICQTEMIPEAFTYKILKKLEAGGIVKSIRGAQGGYLLNRTTRELYLLDIVQVIDPGVGVSQCSNLEFTCERSTELGGCCTNKEFCRIQEIIIEEMRRFTLEEVFNDSN